MGQIVKAAVAPGTASRAAISSHSLGRACVHDLPSKLDAAQQHGLAIDVFHEDLDSIASNLPGGDCEENQLIAAHVFRLLCDFRNLAIVSLQPFMQYEGMRDREKHERRIAEMSVWIRQANILGTDTINIASAFLSEEDYSGDLDLIVADLRELADLGARAGVRFAYESLAWGTYVDTWEKSWEIVECVDRTNFGICLDTFNIAAKVYADPTAANRRTICAEIEMRKSIERMIERLDVKRIFVLQVVDGAYLEDPLTEDHQYYDPSQPPRMSWSRNCRLFYGEVERAAYLPVKEILRAIFKIGWTGWITMEVFNASLFDPRPSVPNEHAQRAATSWRKLVEDFRLKTDEVAPTILSTLGDGGVIDGKTGSVLDGNDRHEERPWLDTTSKISVLVD